MKSITLYHYDFESDNQNILLFQNKTARDAYFNNIQDPFKPLRDKYTTLKIPSISSIEFGSINK